MSNSNRLTGKVALVTGGSQGMGATHAKAIVANGGAVVIGDILDGPGQQLADELGPSATYVHLDVTKGEDWDRAVEVTVRTYGKLNVLVNNAAMSNFGELGSFTRQQWDTVLTINLTGPFLGTTACLQALKDSAPSSIVNISSASGFQGQAGLHGYTASKWGLRGFTKSAAIELAPFGIRVNSVHPGIIRTPQTAGMDLTRQFGPMARAGEPEEVSSVVVYLASDESSFASGTEFVIDGAMLAGPITKI